MVLIDIFGYFENVENGSNTISQLFSNHSVFLRFWLGNLQKHFPNDYSQWMKKTSAEVQKKVNDEDKSN